jgi:AcrR family transcriptional regulator
MSGSPNKRTRATAALPKKKLAASKGKAAGGSEANPAAAARRAAILDAALHVFAEHGYESARLDEVAARAGVAKGTLYLYFKDKEDLFEAMVRSAVAPIMGKMGHLATAADVKAVDVLRMFYTLFQKEVLGTNRKLVLRLIMSEGPRFPRIAEFYYREVVSRGVAVMQAVARRAVETGEFSNDAAARFPQLIIAPLLMAVTWDGLFGKQHPLDMPKLLDAQLELLSGRRTES